MEIIVSLTGQTSVETKGFTGSSCQDASRFLETALGQRMSDRLTAEYHGVDAHTAQGQENQA